MKDKKAVFIKKSNEKHHYKYDYSKVNYINSETKVCIICPEHGEFWQTPVAHVRGHNCPICSNSKRGKRTVTTESLIEKCDNTHNGKYSYKKTDYINSKTKICVTCPTHGDFYILPFNHLRGQGCPKCKGRNLTQDEIIDKFKKIHGNKYDYSSVAFNKMKEKVCIICPEHGEFWQTPYKHISGQGCGRCRQSHLEKEVRLFLQNKKIEFEEQKMFSWLGLKRLDFYLTNYNIAIECQGIQHFKPIDDFGGKNAFIELKIRDKTKRDLCQKHGINLLYFSHENIKFPYAVYTDINILFEKIKEIIDF